MKVNSQLSDVEGQIEELKGKMNFLRDRAAFSTITATIHPERPTPTPTATLTPTATPTPTPTPTPLAWRPGQTYREASGVLVNNVKALGDASIWFVVAWLPCLIPIGLIVGVVALAIHRGKSRRPAQEQPVTPPEEPQG